MSFLVDSPTLSTSPSGLWDGTAGSFMDTFASKQEGPALSQVATAAHNALGTGVGIPAHTADMLEAAALDGYVEVNASSLPETETVGKITNFINGLKNPKKISPAVLAVLAAILLIILL